MKRLILFIQLIIAFAYSDLGHAVDLFGVYEANFSFSKNYTNPYTDIEATAILTSPNSATKSIPLFWDGDNVFKLRFSPDLIGNWTFQIQSNDSALNGQSGSFNVTNSSRKGGITKSVTNPYHFNTQNGEPFYFFGDTQWGLFDSSTAEQLNSSTVRHYLDVRASQGYNVVNVQLMSSRFFIGNEAGRAFVGGNIRDELINPQYFAEVDNRLRYANTNGITVGLFLAWSNGTHSWSAFENDNERLRFARYVVARYSAHNVFFIVSGEWNESLSRTSANAIGNELKSKDPHGRIIGIHSTSSTNSFANESWMSFGDYQQIYTNLHSNILNNRIFNKPVVNSEYAYYLRDQNGDGVVDKPNSATIDEIRHASYDIVMAGGYITTGYGTTYYGGERDPGTFNVDAAKNDVWEEQSMVLKNIMTSVNFQSLNPSDASCSGSGYTIYCLADPGRQYLVYARGATGTFSVNLPQSNTNYVVKRFDPRTGNMVVVESAILRGTYSLSNPNSKDWLYSITATDDNTNIPPNLSLGIIGNSILKVNESAQISINSSDTDGTISFYLIDWGDGVQESGIGSPPQSLSHLYATNGQYQVTVSVSDDGAPVLTSVASVTFSVTSNLPPENIQVFATPNTGDAPLLVQLSASASDPEGANLNYEWDINGDGVIDLTGSNVSTTYLAGNHTATVYISDGVNQVSQSVTIDADETTGGSGETTTIQLQPVADTYIDIRSPDQNYGSSSSIQVAGFDTERIMYLRFDLSLIPSNATVVSADLELKVTNRSNQSGGSLQRFYATNSNWNESAPTWNTPLQGLDGSIVRTLGAVKSGTLIQFDGIQTALSPGELNTLKIFSKQQDGASYASKESSSKPVLKLTYTTYSQPPANLPPVIQSMNLGPSSGTAPLNVNLSAVATDPENQTLIFQWDINGDGNPDINGNPVNYTFQQGVHQVQLIVSDGVNSVTSQVQTVTANKNQSPEIIQVSATPNTGQAPLVVNMVASAIDPEGDSLTYSWDIDGDRTIDLVGSSVTTTFLAGNHIATVYISDGIQQVSQSVAISAIEPGGTGGEEVTIELQPVADTYIDIRNPDQNFGMSSSLQVAGLSTERVIYFRFDLSSIPTNANIILADLELAVNNTSNQSGGTLQRYYPSNANWNENEPTWNSPLNGSIAATIQTLGVVKSGSFVQFESIQDFLSIGEMNTFKIHSDKEDGASYRSKDGSSAPILRITYINP